MRIEDSIIKRHGFGISVIALRLVLLDGTGAVANLGIGKSSVCRAGP